MRLNALVISCAEIQRAEFIRMLQETRLAEFSFTEARTLGDGLVKVDPLRTDVIFLEWEMGMAIGLNFLRKVRLKQRRRIHIALITVEADLPKLEQAHDAASADYFILRPFTARTLGQKLAPLIAKLAAAAKAPPRIMTARQLPAEASRGLAATSGLRETRAAGPRQKTGGFPPRAGYYNDR